MSWLSQVQTGRVIKPRRTFLYGTRGVGKTTWAAGSPQPVFLSTEEGANDIAGVGKGPIATSVAEVMGALAELYTDDHPYKTVAIDTADSLERLIWDALCKAKGVASIEQVDGGYGKGYFAALTYWRELLLALDALRDHRGMAVIILAHSKIKRFDGPIDDAYDRYMPRLDERASDLVQEWADEVFFAQSKTYTKKNLGDRKAKGVDGKERLIYTVEKPAYHAKNRIPGLPEELPLDYAAYAHYATAA